MNRPTEICEVPPAHHHIQKKSQEGGKKGPKNIWRYNGWKFATFYGKNINLHIQETK